MYIYILNRTVKREDMIMLLVAGYYFACVFAYAEEPKPFLSLPRFPEIYDKCIQNHTNAFYGCLNLHLFLEKQLQIIRESQGLQ